MALPSSSIFDRFLDQASNANITLRSDQSRQWFITKARALGGKYDSIKMFKEMRGKFVTRASIGRMYFFYYDPKWKKELPYYDRFPCVIPIEQYGDRFLGLNLHYLPPRWRAIFLARLYEILANKHWDERTKLKITYDILKSAKKFKPFQSCIKMYLKSHVRSKYIRVDGEEWEIAIALPVEDFEKATKQEVWAESRSKW
jgi:hypothetical protein